MISKRVLITVPHLELSGGVTGLFNLLQLNKINNIQYFSVNSNKHKWGIIFFPFVLFNYILTLRKIQVVHINPSLNSKSFYRDMIFAFIAKQLYKRKTIIYWHGWEKGFYSKIKNSIFLQFIFKNTFGVADIQLVLANEFGKCIRNLGYNKKILLESNVTENIDRSSTQIIKSHKVDFKLLFIARITRNKGWDIAIETMKILNNKGFNNIKLTIAGDGDCLEDAKKLVSKYKINNINFTGHITGKMKNDLLKEVDILFFPTCFSEGMPLTILEGVMYGMPIISRNVGGIPDHLKNGVNGYLTDSINPDTFANLILKTIENPETFNLFKINNLQLAKIQFIPERLTNRLLNLYNTP
jgi:glycosyltransferase involved in cell wall biosynthesis